MRANVCARSAVRSGTWTLWWARERWREERDFLQNMLYHTKAWGRVRKVKIELQILSFIAWHSSASLQSYTAKSIEQDFARKRKMPPTCDPILLPQYIPDFKSEFVPEAPSPCQAKKKLGVGWDLIQSCFVTILEAKTVMDAHQNLFWNLSNKLQRQASV